MGSGLAALVVELGTRACRDTYPIAMQRTYRMILYGSDFGPNYSSTATQTTLTVDIDARLARPNTLRRRL